MTTVNRLTFISFALLSCSTGDRSPKPHTSKSPDSSYQIQVDTVVAISDTVKSIAVDNYPVPDKFLDDRTRIQLTQGKAATFIRMKRYGLQTTP